MHEQKEKFNKEIENIEKNKQIMELKNIMTELKNSVETLTADSIMQKNQQIEDRSF